MNTPSLSANVLACSIRKQTMKETMEVYVIKVYDGQEIDKTPSKQGGAN